MTNPGTPSHTPESGMEKPAPVKEAEKIRRLIGLSLSQCIREIVIGTVKIGEVIEIRTSSRWISPESPDHTAEMNAQSAHFNGGNPENFLSIYRALKAQGKIKPPQDQDMRRKQQSGFWIEQPEE